MTAHKSNRIIFFIVCIWLNEGRKLKCADPDLDVTIIEALAQTSAVMVGVAMDMVDKDLLVYFMGIDNAKFRRMVVPGDVVRLAVETTRGKPGGKVWKFRGVATVDGEMAAECDFTAMMDLPKA